MGGLASYAWKTASSAARPHCHAKASVLCGHCPDEAKRCRTSDPARSTQNGFKDALDSFCRGVIACLRPPRHEAVWPNEHGSARCDSIGSRTLTRQVCHVVLADLINVKINSHRFRLISGCLGPGIAAEQIQRRNLHAAPLQADVRGTRAG